MFIIAVVLCMWSLMDSFVLHPSNFQNTHSSRYPLDLMPMPTSRESKLKQDGGNMGLYSFSKNFILRWSQTTKL